MTRLLSLLGLLVAVAGWLVCVRLAVRFGDAAQDGEALSWLWCALAILVAVAWLLLAFVLLRRLAVSVGLVKEYRPKRARR